jgi:nucleotide-binding universal stress UspA family protein
VNQARQLIVVGVDGSAPSLSALRFAVDEAERTGDSIEVITAWSPEPIPAAPYLRIGAQLVPDALQQGAQARQNSVLAQVLGRAPAVPVVAQVLEGDAGTLLVAAAARARLLVVGSRPMGALRAVLLGSVSRYCAHHAPCPVVVVPSDDLSSLGDRPGAG